VKQGELRLPFLFARDLAPGYKTAGPQGRRENNETAGPQGRRENNETAGPQGRRAAEIHTKLNDFLLVEYL